MKRPYSCPSTWLGGCVITLGALLLGLTLTTPAHAQSDEETLALQVKAAFLFNFVKFTTWPESRFSRPSDPINLCVLEPDPFGPILDRTLKDKTVNGRPFLLRRSPRAADLRNCHLVYLGASDSGTLSAELKQLSGSSILLVHENAETLSNGGIRFLVADRKIRFEINLAEIERESLQLSSKLLALSSIVRQ